MEEMTGFPPHVHRHAWLLYSTLYMSLSLGREGFDPSVFRLQVFSCMQLYTDIRLGYAAGSLPPMNGHLLLIIVNHNIVNLHM